MIPGTEIQIKPKEESKGKDSKTEGKGSEIDGSGDKTEERCVIGPKLYFDELHFRVLTSDSKMVGDIFSGTHRLISYFISFMCSAKTKKGKSYTNNAKSRGKYSHKDREKSNTEKGEISENAENGIEGDASDKKRKKRKKYVIYTEIAPVQIDEAVRTFEEHSMEESNSEIPTTIIQNLKNEITTGEDKNNSEIKIEKKRTAEELKDEIKNEKLRKEERKKELAAEKEQKAKLIGTQNGEEEVEVERNEEEKEELSRKGGRGTFSVGCLPKPLNSPKGNVLFPGTCVCVCVLISSVAVVRVCFCTHIMSTSLRLFICTSVQAAICHSVRLVCSSIYPRPYDCLFNSVTSLFQLYLPFKLTHFLSFLPPSFLPSFIHSFFLSFTPFSSLPSFLFFLPFSSSPLELMLACFELERAICPHRLPSSTIAINRHAQFRPHRLAFLLV